MQNIIDICRVYRIDRGVLLLPQIDIVPPVKVPDKRYPTSMLYFKCANIANI